VSDLVACPFCHELFARGEADVCPACGLALTDMSKLPPSHDAEADDPFGIPLRPELEELAWWYAGRGRGLLIVCAVLGFLAFFAPWVDMKAPEIQLISGFALAKRTGWMWGAAVGWFVLLPVALSRRSIDQMRGARVAAAFLSAVPLVTAMILLLKPPQARLIPVRYAWGWGIWATAAIALVALVAAIRFGGRADDIRVSRGSSGDSPQALH